MDTDWTGGLKFHDPLEYAPECEQEDPALEAAVAALEAEAGAVNEAIHHVERAAGLWRADPHGIATRLADRATERFHTGPFLACDHADDIVYVSMWAGAIPAMTCTQPLCQLALDHLIETSRRYEWCGACDHRPECADEITTAISLIACGRLMMPVHRSCLYPIEVGAAR